MYRVDLSVPSSFSPDDRIKLRDDFIEVVFRSFKEDSSLEDPKQIGVHIYEYDEEASRPSEPFQVVLTAPEHLRRYGRLQEIATAVKELNPSLNAYPSAYRLVISILPNWIKRETWAAA